MTLTVKNSKLLEIPVDMLNRVLTFDPDSVRALRAASRALKDTGADFLRMLTEETLALCSSDPGSRLYGQIASNFIDFGMRTRTPADLSGAAFLTSVQGEMTALQHEVQYTTGLSSGLYATRRQIRDLIRSEIRPGQILLPQEIARHNSAIQGASLQTFWDQVLERMNDAEFRQDDDAFRQERPVRIRINLTVPEGEHHNPALNMMTQILAHLMEAHLTEAQFMELLGAGEAQEEEEEEESVPSAREVPPEGDAPAQEIRAWIHGHQPLLQRLTWLSLEAYPLLSIPQEIHLFTGLRTLDFDDSGLAFLAEDAFHGLVGLETLVLAHNLLTSLPRGLFHGLSALRSLALYNNRLITLPDELFHGLTSLEEIHLSGNELISLPETLFQDQTGLQTLLLNGNQLRSLPRGLFRGLTQLQILRLNHNTLLSLPVEIFQSQSALLALSLDNNELHSLPEGLLSRQLQLQELELEGNPHLLFFHEYTILEDVAPQETMDAFFRYQPQSRLATFYQLAGGSASPEAVREAFSALPASIRHPLFGKIWQAAGSPTTGDPRWGENHAFDDMGIFHAALKKHVRDRFENLPPDQKGAVYFHVYQLARRQPGAAAVDFSYPNWGKNHAFDNVPRLIDAIEAATAGKDAR